MSTLPLRIVLAALFLVVFVAGPSLIAFYTDWLWFGEVGYQSVFLTRLQAQVLLFLVATAGAFAWLAVNLRAATQTLRRGRTVFTTRDGIEVVLPDRDQLRLIALGVAGVLGLIIGLYAASQWHVWLTWLNAVPFGETDPLLGHDVSFYLFTLPFLRFLRGLLQLLVVLAALGAGAVYFLSGSINSPLPTSLSMTPAARRHLGLLAAAFLLLLAAGAWLQRPEYLVQSPPTALIPGATYADVHARMPASLALVAASLVGVALALMYAFTRRTWPIPVALALYLLVAMGGEVYGRMTQNFVVSPNEQAREAPYIQHNISATRRAFNLHTVEEREISGDALLTRADITRNATTLQNVRLWDHQPLLDTFGQIQEIRTYYDFVSVDNDRYVIDGTLRQVMLSPRELNTLSLPSRTWMNERLTFTHGYGLTLGPVNQVTNEGLPVLFVRDLPPVSTAGLQVDEPSLYFGELASDWVIVKTDNPEFHYPRGDDNEFTQYSGTGGLLLDSLWRKILFALRFRSYQIVLSDDITPESRILFNRRIYDRVETIAPFLDFDRDPYLVLADGRLFWMYDAYTSSALYPYSTPSGAVNYIRNAVKFTIDAYNGTTTAYLADPEDPIALTYARIFPDLFKPIDEMPPTLRAHVRYPEDIFWRQSLVYRTYHMTQPAVFYNREDQWEIPVVDQQSDGGTMQPYYTIMRLPGETEPEFIQMLPFTPRGRDNLAAWLVARSDGEHYGRLRVFEFPKQKLVYGPRQVVARIAQDQTIAPQITLWNQQGSSVNWGTLMVIPIEESLIYIRPLYLRAAGGRIPELTRVVVAYQDQIVMERTLDSALARLFGDEGPQTPFDEDARGPESGHVTDTAEGSAAPVSPAMSQLAVQARMHYTRALDAQRAGDWARYGEEIRLLGQALERMQQQR